MDKTQLRKHFRELCCHVTPAYRENAGQLAAKILSAHALFKESQHIACYLSYKTEFDSSPIIEAIWQAKKKCYVPVVSSDESHLLNFVHYQYGDPLHTNRYSILEPIHIVDRINPENLDLVIMPVVAFDREGHRLGFGGGYYDRTFAFMINGNIKPILIGLGYASQETKELPSDEWDVKLSQILTEQTLIVVR